MFRGYDYCEETARRKVKSKLEALRSDSSSENRRLANLAHAIGIEDVLHAMCRNGGPMSKHYRKTEGSYQVPLDTLRGCIRNLAASIKAKHQAQNFIKF